MGKKLPFEGGFLMLPKQVLNWPGIDNDARVLFAYLLDHQTNPANITHGAVAYVGTRRIAKDLRLGKTTVQRAVKFLVGEGLVEAAPGTGSLKRFGRGRPITTYRVVWERLKGSSRAEGDEELL